MSHAAIGASIAGATHHTAAIAGGDLHWVSAGSAGTPVLLVHGFPESWWAFRKLIPLLAAEHRVIAVDLPGFGDSGTGPGDYSSTAMADTLEALIGHLDLGPVHLTCQDISGLPAYRLAAGRPELVRSFAGIETALPGFGLERLADPANGGMWHVGFLAAPGIAEMLLTGRERAFLTGYAIPAMSATPGAISEQDVDEFVRVYSRPDGLRGPTGLYGSLLKEGRDFKQIAAQGLLKMPVLAVDAYSGAFTSSTMQQIAQDVTVVTLEGVGHMVAQEAPDALAAALLHFYRTLEG